MPLLALAVLAVPQLQTAPPPAPAAPRTVALQPKAPGPDGRLAWSPKAASVALRRDGEALVGSLALGPAGAPPLAVRLEKGEGSPHYDVLQLDLDRDGAFAAAERLTTKPNEQRGKWWSSFEATAPVPFAAADGRPAHAVPYPLALWYVADPQEPAAKPALRWTRRGWHEGEVEIDGRKLHVLVTELALDGVLTKADAWAIAYDRPTLLRASSRGLDQHAWAEQRAFRATAVAADGSQIVLEPFDPGMTRAEEEQRADVYRADREAKRAAAPVPFGKDFAAALAAARRDGKRVLVDFETTWCGPCKLMDQWVYTAAEVVAAAAPFVAVKLDGDVERELVRRFQIAGYPTLLVLDADGKELRRATGYQSVAEMKKLLAQ